MNKEELLKYLESEEKKTFKGWALETSSTTTFTQLPAGTMGDVTLYAVFE